MKQKADELWLDSWRMMMYFILHCTAREEVWRRMTWLTHYGWWRWLDDTDDRADETWLKGKFGQGPLRYFWEPWHRCKVQRAVEITEWSQCLCLVCVRLQACGSPVRRRETELNFEEELFVSGCVTVGTGTNPSPPTSLKAVHSSPRGSFFFRGVHFSWRIYDKLEKASVIHINH